MKRKSFLTTEFLTTLITMGMIVYLQPNNNSIVYLCGLLDIYMLLRGLVKRFNYKDYTALLAVELYCLIATHSFVIYGYFHGLLTLTVIKLLVANQICYVISRSLTKQAAQKTQTVIV